MNNTLGLDISTTRIGIAVLDSHDNLLHSDMIKFKSELPLEDRAAIFESIMRKVEKKYNPLYVFVEAPAINFRSGSTAHVMAKLQRFNGMCSYVCRKVFKENPELIDVRHARKVLGIKIPRGKGTKSLAKKVVIDYVKNMYEDSFSYNLTYKGNPQPGTDDRADAIVVALGGIKIFEDNP
jgi:Holliday junction resolvasome RuvABC endonuclease subunit